MPLSGRKGGPQGWRPRYTPRARHYRVFEPPRLSSTLEPLPNELLRLCTRRVLTSKNIYICIYGSGSLVAIRKFRDFYKMIPKRTATNFEKIPSKNGSKK